MSKEYIEKRVEITLLALEAMPERSEEIITNIISEAIQKGQEIGKREYLLDTLAHFHGNELEGKRFDFYFVLRNDLDALTPKEGEYIEMVGMAIYREDSNK